MPQAPTIARSSCSSSPPADTGSAARSPPRPLRTTPEVLPGSAGPSIRLRGFRSFLRSCAPPRRARPALAPPSHASREREHGAPAEQEQRQCEGGDDDERQRCALTGDCAQQQPENDGDHPDQRTRQHPLAMRASRDQQREVGDDRGDDERPDGAQQPRQVTEDALLVRDASDHAEHDHQNQIYENHHVPHDRRG